MDATYRAFLETGKSLLLDTKIPKKKNQKAHHMLEPLDADPHKAMCLRAITNKPKKSELIDEFKKFIKVAEDAL
jgi:hypothetical protein